MATLRELRRRKGMSQNDLATAAQLSPSTIYELERTGRKPRAATIELLAVALGVAPEAIDWPTGRDETPANG